MPVDLELVLFNLKQGNKKMSITYLDAAIFAVRQLRYMQNHL